jgi:hypothetical protein
VDRLQIDSTAIAIDRNLFILTTLGWRDELVMALLPVVTRPGLRIARLTLRGAVVELRSALGLLLRRLLVRLRVRLAAA